MKSSIVLIQDNLPLVARLTIILCSKEKSGISHIERHLSKLVSAEISPQIRSGRLGAHAPVVVADGGRVDHRAVGRVRRLRLNKSRPCYDASVIL